ncbi:histidine kinase, partial [Streptomyces sp. NPDC059538]
LSQFLTSRMTREQRERIGPLPAGHGLLGELIRKLPVRPADVCALGRRHGRWHPDSPEARICAGVHTD